MDDGILFGSTELAARIERAESRMMASAAEVARRRDPNLEVVVIPLAGGFATWGGDGSPINKVSGLGFAGTLADDELEAVERAFDERGAPVQVEISNLGDPAIAAGLSQRGYRLVGFENVLGLRIDPASVESLAPGVEIRESGPEELGVWLDVVVGGFAVPDTQGVASHEEFPRDVLERVIGDFGSVEGCRRYLARRAGVPAGGASLRVDDGIAQLTGAATLPEHRRRGVQSSLLSSRLAATARMGCDLATVVTQPGSKSQQNVQRQGFQLLYTRAVLVRAPGLQSDTDHAREMARRRDDRNPASELGAPGGFRSGDQHRSL